MDDASYDKSGKLDLNDIYNQRSPVDYFATLSELGYRIPQEGKTVFENCVTARREEAGDPHAKILDIGCSYGVNAALLKHGLTLDALYTLYDDAPAGRTELVARDRAVYARPADPTLEVCGLDSADNAIAYALEAGVLDAGVAIDLETGPAAAAAADTIGGTDLIISTGCYGYVTERTLEQVLEPNLDRRPWMAHLVLRQFDFAPAEEMLTGYGYVTETADGLFPQRRFATPEEQAHSLDALADRGIDPTGAEAEGWYFAELHLARPRAAAETVPLCDLVAGSARPSAAATQGLPIG